MFMNFKELIPVIPFMYETDQICKLCRKQLIDIFVHFKRIYVLLESTVNCVDVKDYVA